jgi:hypothetical protein
MFLAAEAQRAQSFKRLKTNHYKKGTVLLKKIEPPSFFACFKFLALLNG